jgi:hypothetical protein
MRICFTRCANLFFLFLFLILSATSCEKFTGSQHIPAYITIDSCGLTTNLSTQGSASASIVDAWVYVDDQQIGVFQLPARIPVLMEGIHAVSILPGIKVNGIAATRMSYPFFTPYEADIQLRELDTAALGVLQTTYLPTTDFLMIEAFEGIYIALDTTPRSSVAIVLTSPGSPMTIEGNHSGLIALDTAATLFECVNDRDFIIPFAPVFLEMNFWADNAFQVGVFLYGTTLIQQVPILNLNHTDGIWKKIYVDLTSTLNAFPGMQKFRIFFLARKETQLIQGQIILDNLKIITRSTK